jgi:anti-sigma regulatory factor (Ser/Thr protein kinase)
LSASAPAPEQGHARFRHEALLYEGLDGFVDAVSAFLRDGIDRGEPAFVVVDSTKIGLLREALDDADGVRYADMATVGTNPGRIISLWRDFVAEHAGAEASFRGVGEPVWAARNAEELAECHRHEALLNLAFDAGPAWWLVCPYDTSTLDDTILEAARQSHPSVFAVGETAVCNTYDNGSDALRGALHEPPFPAVQMRFDLENLRAVRQLVERMADSAGLGRPRTHDLTVAVNELAANSIRHGGGSGTLRVWQGGGSLICEVRDQGVIDDPLIGRARPMLDRRDGRGVWLVHHLCDLVQIRSDETGTTVRIHMRTA